MFNFRTDLANERREIYRVANKLEDDINGIKSEEEKIDDNIKVDRVFIINEEGEKAIGKPKGRYLTIDIKKLKIARRRRNSKIGRCNNNRIKKNSI